jgi:hypothetical protein
VAIKVDSGRTVKKHTRITIQFNITFSKPPVVVIAPFWDGGGGAVAWIDTILDVDTTGFTVESNNRASNYYVNWIARGNVPDSESEEPSPKAKGKKPGQAKRK